MIVYVVFYVQYIIIIVIQNVFYGQFWSVVCFGHGPFSTQWWAVFTAQRTLVQSAVLRSHVVCPSVRLSVCNVGGL